MIKTNELRIGNFVSINNGFEMLVHSIFQNNTVYLDFIPPLINEADVWEEDYKDLKAIQLTEEWLLKFGFEKDKYRMSDLVYFEKGDIIIDLNPDGIFKLHIGTVFIKNIHFVHKLQNFYFEYEGSELVFSTEP